MTRPYSPMKARIGNLPLLGVQPENFFTKMPLRRVNPSKPRPQSEAASSQELFSGAIQAKPAIFPGHGTNQALARATKAHQVLDQRAPNLRKGIMKAICRRFAINLHQNILQTIFGALPPGNLQSLPIQVLCGCHTQVEPKDLPELVWMRATARQRLPPGVGIGLHPRRSDEISRLISSMR